LLDKSALFDPVVLNTEVKQSPHCCPQQIPARAGIAKRNREFQPRTRLDISDVRADPDLKASLYKTPLATDTTFRRTAKK
jgi:hypothetical protein